MKKVLAMMLAFALVLVSSACTGAPYVGVDSSELEPFVIGGIGPLTEDRGEYGRSVMQGAKIAVDEINATGGVNGFRLVLDFQDSKADLQTTLMVYDKLMNNGMKVLLGGVYSDETSQLAALTAQSDLLMITPTASSVAAMGLEDNVFRVCFSNARLGTIVANFVADNHLADRVQIYWTDSVFGGKEQVDAFREAFTARGGTVNDFEFGEENPDFESVLGSLERNPPQLIYLAMSPVDTARFLEEYDWDGRESEVKIIGSSALEGLLEGSSRPASLEGMLVATSFDPKDPAPLVQNFVSNYAEAYGVVPDRYAADAYDGIYAIAEALKQAGISSEEVDSRDFNRKMVEAMTKISVHGVTGMMSWTADGETTRPATVRIVTNSAYAVYTKNPSGS